MAPSMFPFARLDNSTHRMITAIMKQILQIKVSFENKRIDCQFLVNVGKI